VPGTGLGREPVLKRGNAPPRYMVVYAALRLVLRGRRRTVAWRRDALASGRSRRLRSSACIRFTTRGRLGVSGVTMALPSIFAWITWRRTSV
jgi:hypothetical protein